MQQLASKVDLLATHNKMLEAPITQQASSLSTPFGRLPSKPEPNPREQCHVMVLGGGKQLEGPKGASNDELLHDVNDQNVKVVEKEVFTPSKEVNDDDMGNFNELLKDSKYTFSKPYTIPLPFPQTRAKAKLDV